MKYHRTSDLMQYVRVFCTRERTYKADIDTDYLHSTCKRFSTSHRIAIGKIVNNTNISTKIAT